MSKECERAAWDICGCGSKYCPNNRPKSADTARERLFAFHESICREAFELMKRKNADYASEEDPLMNFRAGGVLGIVIRKGDKAIRDINLTRRLGDPKATMAVDENLRDTRLDEINYAILALFAESEGMPR